MTLSRVVLPAPLEPISPANSPWRRLNPTSCRISRPESQTLTPSTVRTSSGAPACGPGAHGTSLCVETPLVTALDSACTSATIQDW